MITNTGRQVPTQRCSASTSQGAIAPPIDDPLSNSATAHPLSRRGNHSDTAFVAPGQLPASPRPSAKRKPVKLARPPASEVAIAAQEYQATDRLSPLRVPSTSITRPATVWPTAYATRKPISTQAKSVLFHRYSVFR